LCDDAPGHDCPLALKLFISYPSNQRDLAERLRIALEGEGHSVFTDRAELKEGETYHEALREAVDAAEGLIFLITPRSVAPGSYALTELDLAQRQWRSPAGRVLPVLVEATPLASIPPYLRAVTLLQPKGDVVAETVAAMARLRGDSRRGRWIALAAVLLAIAAGTGWWWRETELERERAAARQALLKAEIAAASQLCQVGSHAVAWDQFTLVASRHPEDDELRLAREDCGMRWLRAMRVRSDKETFSALVDKVQPLLAQGLARSGKQRRADLRAHLGWADFLRSRDGVAAPDPIPQYLAAVEEDAGNVYAQTMWAHNLAWKGTAIDEAASHFAIAARATRERAWVRDMQFAAAFSRRAFYGYTLVAADDMRQQGEAPGTQQRDQIWRYVIDGPMLAPLERRDLLAVLTPADLIATFEWLFPADRVSAERRVLWRFAHAVLQQNTGDLAGAREALEALVKELDEVKDDGRASRATRTLLDELRRPATAAHRPN
jgi:hypothetical protein